MTYEQFLGDMRDADAAAEQHLRGQSCYACAQPIGQVAYLVLLWGEPECYGCLCANCGPEYVDAAGIRPSAVKLEEATCQQNAS